MTLDHIALIVSSEDMINLKGYPQFILTTQGEETCTGNILSV